MSFNFENCSQQDLRNSVCNKQFEDLQSKPTESLNNILGYQRSVIAEIHEAIKSLKYKIFGTKIDPSDTKKELDFQGFIATEQEKIEALTTILNELVKIDNAL